MALDAIIFDVDGTLVDTNNAHVDAWVSAMHQFGYHVSRDRIAVEIGKGGDKLVPSVLGNEADEKHGDALGEAESEAFIKIARATPLRMFPGVEALLRELRRRGIKTALATSSQMKSLTVTQTSAGVDFATLVDHVITADDAKESKPSPDLVTAAVKKLKLAPAQCVLAGDTPHDIAAARDAGLITFGMECGGLNDEKTLRVAGARGVYRDPAALLAGLNHALQTASPGEAHLTQARVEALMRGALAVAREGMDDGEAPIGCVLARGDGTIIARGYNELNRSQNKTAHAEMVAFSRAAGKVPSDATDILLVSTLEPCVMCLGAAMEAAVDTILYALNAPADGGTRRVQPPMSAESQMPRIIGQVLAEESRKLFKEFLKRGSATPQQAKFARQLLDATSGS